MSHSNTISEIRKSIDQKIASEVSDLQSPATLYEPVRYAVESGGKRLRPILLISACRWAGGTTDQALDAAYAMELFHNFTLIHDDIMDQASLRRGKAAVYKKFGLNAALLAGDVMLTLSHKAMTRAADSTDDIELVRRFDDMAVSICEGQQLDSDAEEQRVITVEEYLEIIEKKTAVLVATCLQIGGLLGGANKKESKLLYDYGLMTGKAFQIQDDYLDVYGVSERTGKEKGGDIMMNKKTYLYLKALEHANAEDKEVLLGLFEEGSGFDGKGKVEHVLHIYNKYGVGRAAEQLKESYLSKAMHCLEVLSEGGRPVHLLEQLGQQLIYRSS